MVSELEYQAASTFITLKWRGPIFPPYRYMQHTICQMWYESQITYLDQRIVLQRIAKGSVVDKLIPASPCTITLFAIYNRASIDSGLTVKVSTLGDGE